MAETWSTVFLIAMLEGKEDVECAEWENLRASPWSLVIKYPCWGGRGGTLCSSKLPREIAPASELPPSGLCNAHSCLLSLHRSLSFRARTHATHTQRHIALQPLETRWTRMTKTNSSANRKKKKKKNRTSAKILTHVIQGLRLCGLQPLPLNSLANPDSEWLSIQDVSLRTHSHTLTEIPLHNTGIFPRLRTPLCASINS